MNPTVQGILFVVAAIAAIVYLVVNCKSEEQIWRERAMKRLKEAE